MKRFERALFVLACISMIASGAVYLRQMTKPAPYHLTAIRVGETYHVTGAQGKRTLALELQPSCPHCRAMEPLYRRLAASEPVVSGRIRPLAIVLDDDAQEGIQYATSLGLPALPISIKAGDKFGMPILSTPTMVLLSSEGKVEHVWEGELRTPAAKEEFLAALRK